MKTMTLALTLTTLISFNAVLADDIRLPVITAPTVLDEGTQRTLTNAQIEELLPWAKDSKVFLNDLLGSVQGLNSQDKNETLKEGIKSVVGESSPKNAELFMRYVLNRAIVLDNMLSKEMDADAAGTIDAKNRVLVSSILMAIKYYDNDLAVLSKKSTSPYAKFGIEYFDFLYELNKSIFDASAQYNILRTALEWFQWDLYRDLNNAALASQIVKINNSLKIFPTKKLSDSQSISYIRQIKTVTANLAAREALSKIDQDAAIAFAKTEAERRVLLEKQREEEEFRKSGPVIQAVQSIPMPSINGLNFSSASNANGVCKAMGYQKALADSVQKSDDDRFKKIASIIMEEDGSINGAQLVTTQSGYGISAITCLNKVQNRPEFDVKSVAVSNLGGYMISSKSDKDGVCRLSGYDKAIYNSETKQDRIAGKALILNSKGVPESAEDIDSRTGYSITNIICVQKKSRNLDVEVAKVDTTSFQGRMISHSSNSSGVCKVFGYRSAVAGSESRTDDVYGRGLVLDVSGSPISEAEISKASGYQLTSLACIK